MALVTYVSHFSWRLAWWHKQIPGTSEGSRLKDIMFSSLRSRQDDITWPVGGPRLDGWMRFRWCWLEEVWRRYHVQLHLWPTVEWRCGVCGLGGCVTGGYLKFIPAVGLWGKRLEDVCSHIWNILKRVVLFWGSGTKRVIQAGKVLEQIPRNWAWEQVKCFLRWWWKHIQIFLTGHAKKVLFRGEIWFVFPDAEWIPTVSWSCLKQICFTGRSSIKWVWRPEQIILLVWRRCEWVITNTGRVIKEVHLLRVFSLAEILSFSSLEEIGPSIFKQVRAFGLQGCGAVLCLSGNWLE